MRKFHYKISFIILILRALDLSDSGMGCCCCCSSRQVEKEANQIFLDFKRIFLKVNSPKSVFDFTVGRLSENVKILPRWINDFCLQQRWSSKAQYIPHLYLDH